MTSGLQPPASGIPTPVQGVTGGPAAFGGQISNDPSGGGVVITPNPGNVLQLRKGTNPQGLQIYETFTNNTNYIRLGLYAQTNGPFLITTEFQGSGAARALQIAAGTSLQFYVAGAARLTLDGGGNLLPGGGNNTGSVGANNNQFGAVYAQSFVNSTNGIMVIGQQTGIQQHIFFNINGTTFWYIRGDNVGGTQGSLEAAADNAIDIGRSTTNRPRNIYITSNFIFDSVGSQQLRWTQTGAFINSDASFLYLVGSSSSCSIAIGNGAIVIGNGGTGVLQFGNAFTTSATAGAATALPATPALYFTVKDQSGNTRKIPAYNP